MERWNGFEYHRHSKPQEKIALELIDKHSFLGSESILDIGCGDGKITKYLAEKVFQGSVWGIDSSFSMIEAATSLFPATSNLRFLVADGQNFNLEYTFDLIVSFTAMHWMKDHQKVWQNIKRHLKPEGLAFITFNPPPRQKELEEAICETLTQKPWHTYFAKYNEPAIMPLYTLEEYSELISQQGFLVDSESRVLFFEFETKECLIHNILNWLPHVVILPKELRKEFVTSIVDKFLISTQQKEKLQLKFNNFVIKATHT